MFIRPFPQYHVREAQLSVRDDPNHDWSHPYYWTAFTYDGL